MTELAYSGLGINPHYGTPENPLYPGSVPGGSTSGGAVSVADLSDIAIGTDTGGSTRIPAAFTGITGFKPTQDSISRDGVLTLSSSLDSVGLMAKTLNFVNLATMLWEKINAKQEKLQNKNPKLIIPSNFGFENIDTEIKVAFDLAKKKITEKWIRSHWNECASFRFIQKSANMAIASVECATEYFYLYDQKKHLIDPNVLRANRTSNEVMASWI